ncbi:H-NS family nucleoid-associated regulatory protein [Dechloromonas sp. CZR5]|uniref:H-NS histone family protein n=1 Tax=Dechloromonas sp. CZR5 TaxID=2608630 RepID=UPI00123DDC10|nr:H-NS histone family protein [Dechloromonas sp. CZR5]
MDLSSLSVSQLRDLQQQIPAEIKRREAQEKVNVLNELRAFAKARGYAIEELLAKETKVKVAGNKVKVKYRHPENAELEWTGRGRKPKWIEAWVAGGNTLESLLV